MYWKITACILALMLLTGCTQETPPSTTAATETTAAITTAAHTQPPTDTTQVTEVTEITAPIETTEETVSVIKIEACDDESIKLNFDGEIREFVIGLS